jgi:hypothetical protein
MQQPCPYTSLVMPASLLAATAATQKAMTIVEGQAGLVLHLRAAVALGSDPGKLVRWADYWEARTGIGPLEIGMLGWVYVL